MKYIGLKPEDITDDMRITYVKRFYGKRVPHIKPESNECPMCVGIRKTEEWKTGLKVRKHRMTKTHYVMLAESRPEVFHLLYVDAGGDQALIEHFERREAASVRSHLINLMAADKRNEEFAKAEYAASKYGKNLPLELLKAAVSAGEGKSVRRTETEKAHKGGR